MLLSQVSSLSPDFAVSRRVPWLPLSFSSPCRKRRLLGLDAPEKQETSVEKSGPFRFGEVGAEAAPVVVGDRPRAEHWGGHPITPAVRLIPEVTAKLCADHAPHSD
jgi:hypothetical protein